MEAANEVVSCVTIGHGSSREHTLKVSLEDGLHEMLCSPDIKDLPIIVYSIIGITRSGKSFFFDLLIKYLEENEKFLESGKLLSNEGFPWRHGCNSVTKGIWMWPKIYVLRKENNDKVGIMFVDCEGMFDSCIVEAQCKILVTVTSFISSTLIYNIKGVFSTDNLENIIRFPVDGCANMEGIVVDSLDFKNTELVFLLRDWQDDSFQGGFDGGSNYLNTKMENEIEAVHWQQLKESFGPIKCCLLPHPSKIVTQSRYNGDVQALDEDFKSGVKSFVRNVFSPQALSSATKIQYGPNICKLLEDINGMKIDDKGFSFINVYVSMVNRTAINSAVAEVKYQLNARGLQHHKDILDTAKMNFEKHVRGPDNIKTDAINDMLKEIKEVVQDKMVTSVVNSYEGFLKIPENVLNGNLNDMFLENLRRWLHERAPFPQVAVQSLQHIVMPLYYGRQKTVIIENCDIDLVTVKSLNELIRFKHECILKYRLCAAFESSTSAYNSEKLNLLDDLEKKLSKSAVTLAKQVYNDVMRAEVIESLLPMFQNELKKVHWKTERRILQEAEQLYKCYKLKKKIEMALHDCLKYFEEHNTKRLESFKSTASTVSAGIIMVATSGLYFFMKSK